MRGRGRGRVGKDIEETLTSKQHARNLNRHCQAVERICLASFEVKLEGASQRVWESKLGWFSRGLGGNRVRVSSGQAEENKKFSR